MGNTTWLDIIGSMTTFGILLLIVLRLNASARESSSAYYANYMLQTNMLALTTLLEDDLKHVGAWYTPTVADPTPIRVATTNEFSFMTGNQLIDWKVGLPSEVTSTPNPNDRYVRRNINGVEHIMSLGVTNMTFVYWNIGDPTIVETSPITQNRFGNIGPIDVSIQLESPYKTKQQYMNDTTQYEIYWRQIRSVSRTTLVQIPQ